MKATDMICDDCQALYEEVGEHARDAGVFARVRRNDLMLMCKAKLDKTEASYRVEVSDKHDIVYVGLYTPDRWLNESIEADLLHRGDKPEELIEEEIADLGFEARLPVEHFRNEQKQYVFRSPIFLPKSEKLCGEGMVDRVTKLLIAYEAVFRQLGKMDVADSL
ncbi:MAG: hypothetical protein K8S99_05785 [Planctomycetes bacterium]|nr:hypothetical protein [Planctomycetota bacterium]